MSSNEKFYAGRIAVVTGAGSGIGQAIARRLGGCGAVVHCVDVDGEAASATAATLSHAHAHAVDVTDAEAMVALAERVYETSARVDLLFNNAGIGQAGLLVETELADWRRTLDINVMGVVHGLHAFLPRMQAQPGRSHIINTASGAGLVALPRMAAYCASKHAVVGLSQSLAMELADTPIGITILCPGVINTAIVKNTAMSGSMSGSQSRAVKFYEKNGATPDSVACDLLEDVRRNRQFCISPRVEVGIGWLAQRLSPALAQRLMRFQSNKVLGLK